MEILYGFGMTAVFVLCLALLSTARRILRSSPLSSAQFGTTRMYEVEHAEEELLDGIGSMRDRASVVEAAHFESTLVLDEPFILENVAMESAVIESAPAKTIVAEPVIAAALPVAISTQATEPVEPGNSWASKWARFPKPTRQTYNYALECLLIGISAYALIKTQRETQRFKAAPAAASRDRVA